MGTKLRVMECFGGIGACSKALKNIGVDVEIVDYVEIDKYAVLSFNEINKTHFKPQDITKWDKDIEVDLIMHGSPCQDFSLAGKQAGGDKGSGTRSSLMYETIRIVEKLKPKYVVWENVKNLISKKHRHNFDAYLETMSQLGYTNYWQVLNAKDYGIPQNRERVFTISILGDDNTFEFPERKELKLKLKDMLEDSVDESFYLSDKMVDYVCSRMPKGSHHLTTGIHMENKDSEGVAGTICTEPGNKPSDNYIIDNDDIEYSKKEGYLVDKETQEIIKGKSYLRDFGSRGRLNEETCQTLTSSMGTGGGNVPLVEEPKRLYGIFDKDGKKHQAGSVWDTEGLSPTIDTMQGGYRQPCIEETLHIKNATKQGYLEAKEGDGVDISTRMEYHRGNVQPQMAHTIDCQGGNAHGVVTNNLRIRKLTPKECWRLQGFDDESYEAAARVCSKTQLYKQAGNSICVKVLECLFKNLIKENK